MICVLLRKQLPIALNSLCLEVRLTLSEPTSKSSGLWGTVLAEQPWGSPKTSSTVRDWGNAPQCSEGSSLTPRIPSPRPSLGRAHREACLSAGSGPPSAAPHHLKRPGSHGSPGLFPGGASRPPPGGRVPSSTPRRSPAELRAERRCRWLGAGLGGAGRAVGSRRAAAWPGGWHGRALVNAERARGRCHHARGCGRRPAVPAGARPAGVDQK